MARCLSSRCARRYRLSLQRPGAGVGKSRQADPRVLPFTVVATRSGLGAVSIGPGVSDAQLPRLRIEDRGDVVDLTAQTGPYRSGQLSRCLTDVERFESCPARSIGPLSEGQRECLQPSRQRISASVHRRCPTQSSCVTSRAVTPKLGAAKTRRAWPRTTRRGARSRSMAARLQ